ncbi:ATP-dependent zinc protease family protein [Dyadobacter arcticus]|uniref:Retropepsin-like aspartic endopeptidase domain-containing protein n=1 Tax=Dyadobacter arcticus TaxID=1078754 RepID=A0ABX0UUB8_9BACT|nr:RimK/LysX family protein [Dyadobacter arcticus]NIJ55240.1 hypothetical protein [Dyadobacter arcticus]
MKNSLQVIGATDIVDLPELGWFKVPVRIDSGAATSAIHCSRVRLIKDGEKTSLHFDLDTKKGAPQHSYVVTEFKETTIRNSSGIDEKRYVIKTRITLFGKKIRTEFSLANRGKMSYPILLGRKLLKNRFIVDVSQKNLSHAKRSSGAIRSKVKGK